MNSLNTRPVHPILLGCAVLVCTVARLSSYEELGTSSEFRNDRSSRDQLSRLVAEATDISEVQLAPDARHIAYTIAHGSVERNDYVVKLILQDLTSTGAVEGKPRILVDRGVEKYTHWGTFTPRWCPRSDCLSYFDTEGAGHKEVFIRYDLATARTSRIEVADDIGESASRPRVSRIDSDYRWSPTGNRIAFTAPISRSRLNARHGVNVSADWGGEPIRRGLFILDAATGQTTQVTPDSLHVIRGFSWAPDEQSLVFAATEYVGTGAHMQTRLFVVDRVSKKVRPLVTDAGACDYPSWSPNGQWVSFISRQEVGGGLGLVPAAGGPVSFLADERDKTIGSYSSSFERYTTWSADSRTLYLPVWTRLNNVLLRASVPSRSGAAATLSASLVGEEGTAYDEDFSLSSDARMVAFIRRQGATSPALMIGAASTEGVSEPRTLVPVDEEFASNDTVRVDVVTWPSPDGKFVLNGVLLTPVSAWSHGRVSQPLPTIVCVKCARPGAELGDVFVQLPLVGRGYAVLVPQIRGRYGAGEAFKNAIKDGKSYIRLPMNDVLAGVDVLIERGVADPARLGVYGLSQGGTQVSGFITMTDRFKAAVVFEAHFAESLTREFLTSASTVLRGAITEPQGGGDVYQRDERARLEAESPVYNLDRVRTPTLLLFGAKSYAPTVGRMLFNGLQKFGVPSEFVIYDEGHNFQRPSAIADYMQRMVSWFDYWLQQTPYPDSQKQREYDSWARPPIDHSGRPLRR